MKQVCLCKCDMKKFHQIVLIGFVCVFIEKLAREQNQEYLPSFRL